MEIRVYDNNLDLCGVTENQRSLLWHRRYSGVGTFEAQFPITDYNISLIQKGRLISMRGATEAGIIEDLYLVDDLVDKKITATGRFLSSYMDRRLIRPTINYSGTVEDAMRKILSDAHPIPSVVLGTRNGFPETVEFQASYKNLLDYEQKLARSAGFGFRFRPDFTAKQIVFEVYKGANKTRTNGELAFVEFSEKFDNINASEYRYNCQLLKNIAYVGGEGEGAERVYTTVGDLSVSDQERREMFVDAKDVRKEDGMTDAQYVQLLKTRGMERLLENAIEETFSCTTEAFGNFVYKKDYDLGDVVTARNYAWGIYSDLRIAEVEEIYEYGSMSVNIILGSPFAERIDWREDNV